MAIKDSPGRSFDEYTMLPGYTPKGCTLSTVNLETRLAEDLTLRIPFLSAAMTSVTGYNMALALGKEGGMAVLPARLPIDEQADIVRRIKTYETGFVDEPLKVREYATIADVLSLMDKQGHSRVPIVDLNNRFLGIFEKGRYYESNARTTDPATSIMTPLDQLTYCQNPNITIDEAKAKLQDHSKYLIVLDDQRRLVKLAFAKDIRKINVASAISTHQGWQERADANISSGVDLIVIDTSDAYTEFVSDVVREYKERYSIPLCAGNVVTEDGAFYLMQQGADMIKLGMSVGSICTTAREKAVGRAQMPTLEDAVRARQRFFEESGRYVPLIWDGGVSTAATMIIALAAGSDAVMMGNYFNRFFEAAGEKYDRSGKLTTLETEADQVATWGEGSDRAQNLERYGHASQKTFFAEGVEARVDCVGRLKPNVKRDIIKIKAAMANVGCYSIRELHEKAVLEPVTSSSFAIVKDVHDLIR
jgi:IMP dehydrogenase